MSRDPSRPDDLPAVASEVDAVRYRHDAGLACIDRVAEECPVALVFNGIAHAVMMATPRDLEAFATGFALSEGIVAHPREIHDIEADTLPDGIELRIEIAQSAFVHLKERRRTLAGRTGCGVCGTESLALLDLQPERVTPSALDIGSATLSRILAALPAHQPLTRATGGAHAAAWCSAEGAILQSFEDVGRHNALDKLLGWMARAEIDPGQGLVFLTSRASYELVRKAARRNVGLLATISAPTALAIRIARSAGIRLISFCRESGFTDFSTPPDHP